MDAIVIDLNDFTVRTPEQVVRVFFKLYDAAKIKAELWYLFGSWASGQDKQVIAVGEETQVALLFDQLIALVNAVEMLREGNTRATCCVVCGSKIIKRGEEGPRGQA